MEMSMNRDMFDGQGGARREQEHTQTTEQQTTAWLTWRDEACKYQIYHTIITMIGDNMHALCVCVLITGCTATKAMSVSWRMFQNFPDETSFIRVVCCWSC